MERVDEVIEMGAEPLQDWLDKMVDRAPRVSPPATLALGVAGFGAQALAGTLSPRSIGEVSARRYGANEVIPTPGTFGIWGFIYAGLGGLLVYQALPSQRHNPRLENARFWLAATPWANAAWIALTGFERVIVANGVLDALWIGGRALHRALEIGRTDVDGVERWLRVPVSVYTGWLNVAEALTGVNFAIDLGWSARTPEPRVWGPAVIAATALGAAFDVRHNHDPWLGVPVLVGLAGIAKKHARKLGDSRRQAKKSGSGTLAKFATGLAVAGAAWLAPKLVGWLRR